MLVTQRVRVNEFGPTVLGQFVLDERLDRFDTLSINERAVFDVAFSTTRR